MSSILKLALCPAPFQKKKGDKKNKGKKGMACCPEPSLQHVLTDTFIPPFRDTTVCSTGMTTSAGYGSSSVNSRLGGTHQHSSVSPRSSTSSNGHHQPQAMDTISVKSSHFNSSGYQSSDYHHRSGYVTDGDGGAFEAQILQRATRERPANLKMTAVRDYAPGCNEELAVRKGQRVKVLYRNHDWVFAVTKHGNAGFLPFSYVRPSRKYGGYQSEPEITRLDEPYASGYDTDVPMAGSRQQQFMTCGRNRYQYQDVPPPSYSINTSGSTSSYHRTGSGSPVQTKMDFDSGYLSAFESSTNYHSRRSPPSNSFRPIKPSIDSFGKCYLEELVVIHDFDAHEEDEVLVFKGDRVQVLNADDPHWLWVATLRTRREGFIPRSCCTLGNHPALSTPVISRPSATRHHSLSSSRHHHHNSHHHHHSNSAATHRNMKMQARDRFRQLALDRSVNDPTKMDKDVIKKVGTKLIVLMDYEATTEDELTLEFSESVIADILTQTGSERIWVYCPRTDECGYVPMSMVVPPVV